MNILGRFFHISRVALYFPPVLLLGGCSVFSAATLPEVRGQTNHLLQLSAEECPTQNAAEMILSGQIIDILYAKGADAFKGYLEKKADRFTAQYSAFTTIDNFSAGRCLRIKRIDPSSQIELMDLLLEIRSRGANSMEIAPASLTIRRFAASTSPDNGVLKARLTVSIGLSFVNSPPIGPNPITELTLPVGSVIYEIGRSPPDVFSSQTSKLFPNLSGIPVNVAVTVLEAGSGSEVFDSAVSGFDKNANDLKAMLGQLGNN